MSYSESIGVTRLYTQYTCRIVKVLSYKIVHTVHMSYSESIGVTRLYTQYTCRIVKVLIYKIVHTVHMSYSQSIELQDCTHSTHVV